MMAVEDLLGAFALACDSWLDPEVERENPLPEYAALIRRAVSVENDALRELVLDFYPFAKGHASKSWLAVRYDRMRELGVEVEG